MNPLHGKPQGSILGPVLFTMYMLPLEQITHNISLHCHADDTHNCTCLYVCMCGHSLEGYTKHTHRGDWVSHLLPNVSSEPGRSRCPEGGWPPEGAWQSWLCLQDKQVEVICRLVEPTLKRRRVNSRKRQILAELIHLVVRPLVSTSYDKLVLTFGEKVTLLRRSDRNYRFPDNFIKRR